MRRLMHVLLWLTCAPVGTSAAAPVAWLHTPTMLQLPDSCVGFGRLDSPFVTPSEICPDPQGSLLIQSQAAQPSLLLQTSSRGRLVRMGGLPAADTTIVDGAFLSQALSARQLSDGDTLVMSADLNAVPTLNGRFRPALSLLDSSGVPRWNVPLSALQSMSSRDGRAGFVAELSPGGDLIAVLQTEVLTAVRVRRSDGRVEARTVLAVQSARPAAHSSSGSNYSSVPFQAWLGPAGLHVLSTARWLTLDPHTLAARSDLIWRERLASSLLVPAALVAIHGSDEAALLTYGPYLNPTDQNCTLLRVRYSGDVIWTTQSTDCAPEPLLERVGSSGLIYSASLYSPFRRVLSIVNLDTGASERQIEISRRARSLASTSTMAAYLAYGDLALELHGVDLADGAEAFQGPIDFPADSELPGPIDALLPNLLAVGADRFMVHGGRSRDFKSLGFVAEIVDAQTGSLLQRLEPGPMAMTTSVSVVADTGNSLIVSTHPADGSDWPRRIEGVSAATGKLLWVFDANPIWDRSNAVILANSQQVLIAELRRLEAPDRFQLHQQLLDASSGVLVNTVSRLFDAPSSNSSIGVSLDTEGRVVVLISSAVGVQATGLDAAGNTAWQKEFPQGYWSAARTDRGHWLLRNASISVPQLELLSATDGTVRSLGALEPNQSLHSAIELGQSAGSILLLSSRSAGGQRVFSAQRRDVDQGLLWTHESAFPGNPVVLLLASALLPDQDLVYEIRSNPNVASEVTRRTLRLDGASGTLRWQQIETLDAGVSAGCRAFLMASNGDLLCPEAYGRTADTLSGVDPALTYVRRLDALTGAQIGVHWLSIESDVLRGLLQGDGPSTRIFRALANAGFAFTGPAPGERAFTTGSVGWIDRPAIQATGDVSVSTTPSLEGLSFSIRNDSNAAADAVRWALDASDSAGIDTLNCSNNMLAGATHEPYAAQGTLDLAAAEVEHCELRWLPGVPAAQRTAMVYAWPAYGYLDTDASNNVSVVLAEGLLADGFE